MSYGTAPPAYLPIGAIALNVCLLSESVLFNTKEILEFYSTPLLEYSILYTFLVLGRDSERQRGVYPL